MLFSIKRPLFFFLRPLWGKQESAAAASCFVVEFLSPGVSPFNLNFGDVLCLVIVNSLLEL